MPFPSEDTTPPVTKMYLVVPTELLMDHPCGNTPPARVPVAGRSWAQETGKGRDESRSGHANACPVR